MAFAILLTKWRPSCCEDATTIANRWETKDPLFPHNQTLFRAKNNRQPTQPRTHNGSSESLSILLQKWVAESRAMLLATQPPSRLATLAFLARTNVSTVRSSSAVVMSMQTCSNFSSGIGRLCQRCRHVALNSQSCSNMICNGSKAHVGQL